MKNTVFKIVEKLLGLEWLGDIAKQLNGNKTILGGISLLLYILRVVPLYFPEWGMAPQIADSIQEALLWIGILLPVGAAHKVAKLAVGKPQKPNK